MFFSNFNEYTRQVFKEDKEKHNVICWINYNTNYSTEEYEGLKQGECKFSYSVIENELNIGHKKALNVMKQLQEEGFILAFYKSNNRHKSSILMINLGTSKSTSTGTSTGTSKSVENTNVVKCKEPVQEPVQEPVKEPSSIKLSKKQSKNNNNSAFYEEIINYLNEKTGSKFKASTPNTQQHINARLKEGYTIDDFKAVIDNKVTDWKDKISYDKSGNIKFDGNKCLRPKTLFSGNFESYLNEKHIKKETVKQDTDSKSRYTTEGIPLDVEEFLSGRC